VGDTYTLEDVMEDARMALRAGDAVQAMTMLQARQIDGWNNGKFLTLLGVAECLTHQPEDALPLLERALDLAPSEYAHYNLGQCYQMLGRVEDAKAAYTHAIGIDHTYGKAIEALTAFRDAERAHEAAVASAQSQEPHHPLGPLGPRD